MRMKLNMLTKYGALMEWHSLIGCSSRTSTIHQYVHFLRDWILTFFLSIAQLCCMPLPYLTQPFRRQPGVHAVKCERTFLKCLQMVGQKNATRLNHYWPATMFLPSIFKVNQFIIEVFHCHFSLTRGVGPTRAIIYHNSRAIEAE